MMRVTVIENPKPSQPKVNFKVGGEWCTCYIQGDAWEPGCEELYTEWCKTTAHRCASNTIKKIDDETLPWNGAGAYFCSVVCGEPNTWGAHVYPYGLWVGSHLAKKRTRNPKCFRGTRYFVAWKPGSEPPFPSEELHDVKLLVSPTCSLAPDASTLPLPFGLSL